MTDVHEVLLECRRFDVVVSYHPYDGLTPIESHLLRAVVAGADSLDALSEHLRLPQQLVLDAALDLLAAGLLEIAHEGRLTVSSVVSERMGAPECPTPDWDSAFATAAAPEPETVTLLQEMVSGGVFRMPPRSPIERRGLPRLPPDPDLPPPEEIPPTELLFAVLARAVLPDTDEDEAPNIPGARPRSDARVGEVLLRRSKGSSGGLGVVDVGRVHLLVRLTATQEEERATPRFQVVEPTTIPGFIRRRIATGLSNLWERNIGRETGQLFSKLAFSSRSELEGAAPALGDPFQEIRRLDEEVAARTATPSIEAHELLYEVERDVADSIVRAAQRTATIDLVVGARAHHEAMTRALREAKQQVVLACPWVRRLSVVDVREQIDAAVSRGVLVCLMWGIEREERLDEETLRFLLDRARHGSGGGVIVSERSAISHAKVIACDHDWVVVSSCNYLSSGPERSTDEVGVRLSSPPPRVERDPDDERTAPSHPISEILCWVRDIMPDFRLRQRIMDSPALLGMAERSRRAPAMVDILPPQIDTPLSVKLWSRAWRQRVGDLRRQLETARPMAIPVRDAEHRELLLHALERAQRRLYLESPDVGAAGLSEPVIEALKRARARGADVRLRYHERAPGGPEADARWRSLADAGVGMAVADTHAKLLVCDDWVVIGSFNFLSFAGRGRRELGVRVFDADAADRLSARFSST